tara:strand:- start:290 stop:1153 length:864 start_codon:yes stop_codon:yes gene_type:complete
MEDDKFYCKRCGTDKSRDSFYKDKKYSTGIRQPCKDCCREKAKERRNSLSKKDPEIPETKKCSKCHIVKDANLFGKRADSLDGLRSHCKSCINESSREFYKENSEKIKSDTDNYRKNNLDKYAEWKRLRRSKDIEKYREKEQKYREDNRDKINAYHRDYNKQNRVDRLEVERRYISNNADKCKERSRKWRNKNKDKVCYYAAKRRANLKQATPPWANQDIIKSFYKEASYFQETVDHIIPLTHSLVCGLHTESNLQILPFKANCSKSNSFQIQEHLIPEWVDIEEEF